MNTVRAALFSWPLADVLGVERPAAM